MQNQKAMEKDLFRVDAPAAFANRYRMAPDANLNVTIRHESKKLATSINLKRLQWGEVSQRQRQASRQRLKKKKRGFLDKRS